MTAASLRTTLGPPIGAGFLTLLVQLPIFDRGMTLMDEGHILHFADLLLRGGELYRDATLIAFPGAFYGLAALFGLFEPSILVARWAVAVQFAVVVGLVVALLRGWLGLRGIATVVAALWIYRLWAFPHWQMYSYSTSALCFVAAALMALVHHLERGSARALALSGFLGGLAVFCKQDYGGAAILAFNATLAVAVVTGDRTGLARRLALFNGAGALVGLAMAAHYLRVGLLGEMLRQTITNHLVGIATFEYSSLPPILPLFEPEPLLRGAYGLAVYAPPLVGTLAWREVLASPWYQETVLWDLALKAFFWTPYLYVTASLARCVLRRDALRDPATRTLALRELALALLGALLVLTLHKPKDWVHMAVVLWPLVVLAGVHVQALRREFPVWGPRVAAGCAGLVACGALASLPLAAQLRIQHDTPLESERARIYVKSEEGPVLDAAVRWVREHTAPDETMAILPYFPGLHFLAARDAPHRSTYILWPVEEVPGREGEIIERLEAADAPRVLYHFAQWAQFPRMDAFAPELYAYLVERYRVERVISAEHWGYTLAGLARDPEPALDGDRPIFDDGLANATLFVEDARGRRRRVEGEARSAGARRTTWPFRPVLALRPALAPRQAVLSTSLEVAAGDRLRTAIGIHPDRWVHLPLTRTRFTVRVIEDNRVHVLHERILDPSRNSADRGWFELDLPLDAFAGRRVRLEFTAQGEGRTGDALEMGGFGWPRLTSGEPGAATPHALVRERRPVAVSGALTKDADPRCPVCSSPEARLRYRITDFRVHQCDGCGVVYLWPQMSDAEVQEMFTRLYTEGEGSVPELKSYYGFTYDDDPANPLVQLYEKWLTDLERHRAPGRLLDIGCGTGLFLAVARRRGWEPFGVDDCSEATDHARSHFGIDVWDGTFTDFVASEEPFDAITMWDIIEHARDPVGLLDAARAVLAPGGVMGISTPNQRSILDVVAGAMYRASFGAITAPLEKFYIEQHFLYFTPESLADSLRRAGLEMAYVEREITDLRRLTLAAPMRLALRTLFAIARRTGLENRIYAVARAAPSGRDLG